MRAFWRLPLVLASLVALHGCGLFGGDEIEDPPAELVKFKSTLDVRRAWSAGLGGGTEYLRLALAPASDGARIFAAAHDGRLAAFEAEQGKRLWRAKTALPLSAGPATDGDIVVAGSNDGDVLAVDANTGDELWRVRVSSEVLAAPVITQGLVLVRTVDGKLRALRREDGSEAWFALQNVPRLSVRGTGAPAVAGNAVIGGYDNGKVAAYDLSTGSLLWEVLVNPPKGRTEVDRLTDINASVLVLGEEVYAAAYQGGVTALAAANGQTLWSRDISSYSGPAADFLAIYVTDQHGEIHALARRTGREMWVAGDLRNRDVTGPAVVGNAVVVGDFAGYVHWFNAATGALEARQRAGSDRISAAPLVVNGMVYVQNEGGKLYAFRERPPKP